MATHKRWRKLKSTPKPTAYSAWVDMKTFSLKNQLRLMYASERIKAFITDMFMINMPLLYLTTYVFLDGKEGFTHNQIAILTCGICYGIITSLFFTLSAQTPGYRYMNLKLVCYLKTQDSHTLSQQNDNKADSIQENLTKVSFIRAFIRYVLWVIGTSFLFGILVGIFRTDGRCLHDLLCRTQIIPTKQT
ncbi:RDD family protein [uncultured Helicobacter sp.]|uniref:RDD family protein n=2 Tax=uncultured Helicobacter sp. TaxID=175537 RepID=UPI00262BBEBE|nr:RDD family protein [uncultured Helicobacter sp.]